jgi:hypothetical protein
MLLHLLEVYDLDTVRNLAHRNTFSAPTYH